MEGIQYDPEKEDVTLERIEAEDGSAYHPDQAGKMCIRDRNTIGCKSETKNIPK